MEARVGGWKDVNDQLAGWANAELHTAAAARRTTTFPNMASAMASRLVLTAMSLLSRTTYRVSHIEM